MKSKNHYYLLHTELSRVGIRWLYDRGCQVFANEVPTRNGIADALGVKVQQGDDATVYYIEAKASRSDLICRKQKSVYQNSIRDWPILQWGSSFSDSNPGIDFYYLIVGDGIYVEPFLYPEWGVINKYGKVIRKAKRIKHKKKVAELIMAIAHVLVYKQFGKLYLY